MLSRILRQLTSRKGDLWLMSAQWTAPVLGMIGGLIAVFLSNLAALHRSQRWFARNGTQV